MVYGSGLSIQWQDGPLGRGDQKKAPKGAFVETVIAACIKRLRFYQQAGGGKFKCDENAEAMGALQGALLHLNNRTARRNRSGTEGSHEGN